MIFIRCLTTDAPVDEALPTNGSFVYTDDSELVVKRYKNNKIVSSVIATTDSIADLEQTIKNSIIEYIDTELVNKAYGNATVSE